jgi:hypothetical protein
MTCVRSGEAKASILGGGGGGGCQAHMFPTLTVHPSPLFIDEDGKGPDSSPLDGWLDNLLSGVKGWTKNLYGLPACSLSDIIPLLYSPLSFISDMQSSIERHLQKVFQQ